MYFVFSLPHRYKCEYNDAKLLVAPGAKMYLVEREPIDEDGSLPKTTKDTIIKCKGVQQKINPLRKEHYMNAIYGKANTLVCNKGFKINQETSRMNTYQMFKKTLGYMYIKRRVMEDNISTTALDL